jgi:hypothetical protein
MVENEASTACGSTIASVDGDMTWAPVETVVIPEANEDIPGSKRCTSELVYNIRSPAARRVLGVDRGETIFRERNGHDAQEWVINTDGFILNKKSGEKLITHPHALQQFQYTRDGMIVDGLTGKVLSSVEYTTGTRAVTAANCELNNLHQQWALVPLSSPTGDGETYTIRHPGPGLFLDVKYSEDKNGTLVHLWERNGTGAQYWVFDEGGLIRNPMTGKLLNAGGYGWGPGKETIEIWEKHQNGDLKSQAWKVPSVEGHHGWHDPSRGDGQGPHGLQQRKVVLEAL